MTEADEDRLKIVGDYKHGSIRRIRLTNFLTYSQVEFSPGPRLNMVVGPNGTGKSTILCAICLGLGGEPRLLGRASDIETFVMNGEDEGEIEIEVVNTEGGENPIIRRVIRRDASPKSSFFWNDKGTTGKHVRETCLQKYQISVDNLCTFLPQDRVGSFSGFDAKQLLIETEKSLSSSQHLYHTHQQLIQDQIDLQGGTNQVETLEEKLQQLQVENQRLEREKQRMEERQVALEQAELLRKKLIWLKFDEARCEANAKKEAKQNLKLQVREAAALATPLEEKATDLAEQLTRCTKDFATLDKHIKSHQTEMQKQTRKYEMHDDAIETTLQELNAMDSHRAQLESKVQQHKEKVENYNQILEQSPSMDALQEEELQARNDHKAAHPEYEAAKRDLRQLEEELRDVDEEHREKKKKWTKLQDEKARRRERVFRQQNNLRQSYEWLQNNRNQFRKEVIGPIVCEITPKSRNTAAYLEQHVPNSTLKSFVVQCKEDYDLLYQSVRQGLKVPINIIVVKDIPPPKPRQYSEQKMQVLKRDHGVIGYCDESFTAPDIVVQALKATSAIDKVLVGTEKTQQSLDNNNLLDYLAEPENGGGLQSCCIFASEGDRSFKYTSTISKYSGKPSLRVDEVRPAKWLAPGVSDEEKGKVEQELNELDQRKEKAQTAVQDANNKVAEIQQQAQSIMTKLKTAKANVGDLQKLINKLRNAQHKLKEAEKEVATDDEDEKKQKIGQLNKRIRHSLLALDAQAESYKKMMIATVKISGARLNREVVVVEERKARLEHAEIMRRYEEIERALITANNAFKEAKRRMIQWKAEADEKAPLEDADGKALPLIDELNDLPVETLEEAELALEEAETKANSIVADPNVIRQYEARKREMEQVQAELDDLTGSRERRLDELDQKVKPWEQMLDNSVAKIDALFSTYMREMGCTGEIRLAKGSQSDDAQGYGSFKEWGVEIRVSFRENVKPQVLCARVQSGGERSVSTIMYLMALQGMMVAPFRCVDEINQGLDDRNERLVFRRIVENSTKEPGPAGPTDHAGQYFLITPKLLPNLYDMEVEAMTVLFIFNGPYNFKTPMDWDVPKLVGLRNRAVPETEAAGDEENTPNSQPGEGTQSRAKRSRASLEPILVDNEI